MKSKKFAKTLKELKKTEYVTVSVRDEIRKNLIARMKNKEELFPGMVGQAVRRKMQFRCFLFGTLLHRLHIRLLSQLTVRLDRNYHYGCSQFQRL